VVLKSEHYYKFKSLCCEAYNILRKSANLIINLFYLMIDANIPQINGEKSIKMIEERFRLELTDEEASRVFQQLINESVNAIAPQVTETLHTIAKSWRDYWQFSK